LLMCLKVGGLRRGMLFLFSKSCECADEVVRHELFLLPSFILLSPCFLLADDNECHKEGEGGKRAVP
jgi:hypothetical protein